MAGDLKVRGMRGIAGHLSANAGECQTPFLYGGPNLTPHTPHTPQIVGSGPITVESIVRDLEGALDFALSLRDAGAAVEAILGMAAVQELAADRAEVTAAVSPQIEKA